MTLSRREHAVMRLACDGLPNKAIAAELGISMSMTEKYLARAASELGARSTREAIRRYTERYLTVTAPRRRPAPAQDDLGLA
jgi:DNA-binding NarL/FixJ family response regulator